MAPNSTIHLIRHAEGYHQLPPSHPDISLHDPELTPNGREQCQRLRVQFTRHEQVDLLCASPMRRTLLTALLAFEPEVARGLNIVAVADAQESTSAPADTGSPPSTLIREFGDRIDCHNLSDDWYVKTGHNAVDDISLFARARALRQWLRGRKEKEIVVVTHGSFAHFITGDINEHGEQIGGYWNNVMERSFCFQHEKDDDAKFVETVESREKTATDEHIKYY
ncbi:hypothetical protein P7C71_g5479, partial [Lecanoromycetidae sp. Uapishka_2]